eukprot:3507027-Prymnesium_polylepis.1
MCRVRCAARGTRATRPQSHRVSRPPSFASGPRAARGTDGAATRRVALIDRAADGDNAALAE